MDKKEYLSQYRKMKERVKQQKELIAFYNERSFSVPGSGFGGIKIDCEPSYDAPYVKWIYKKLEAEEVLKNMEVELAGIRDEIEIKISTVGELEYQKLLIFRYIDCMTWPEIGIKMNMASTTLKRKHRIALNLIKI